MPYTNRNKVFFSRLFLLIVGVIYFINLIYASVLPEMLSLVPSQALDKLQIWKLLTFPFTYGTLEAVLLFAVTFYFISPRLEEIIDNLRYPSWLFLLSILHGCSMTLIFWRSDVVIAGMEGVSFFVLTLFMFLKPKSMVEFMKFPPLSTILFTLAIVFLWFGIKIIGVTSGTNTQFIPQFSSAVFGITMGAMIYLQIRLANKREVTKFTSSYPNRTLLPHEEMMATLSNLKLKKQYRNLETDTEDELYPLLSEDPSENEDTLNEILDKIIDLGNASLTPAEKKFLEDYSRQL